MQISDEELIAFLLDDVDASLKSRIKSAMQADPSIAQRLNHLRFVIGQVDSLQTDFQPPADLVESTMQRIDAEGQADIPLVEVASKVQPRLGASKSSERSSFVDSAVLCLSLATICCLILPAVVKARYDARKAQCAENLRTVGQNLIQYAESEPAGRFPHVPLAGREAFAGIFTVRLAQSGLELDPLLLRCSSLIGVDPLIAPLPPNSTPDVATLHRISAEQLARFQRLASGSYASSLGVTEGARVVAPRYQGRAHFALLSDAPVIEGNTERFIAHGGRGINVFYEDGRVVYLSTAALNPAAVSPVGRTPSASEVAPFNAGQATPPTLGDDPLRNLQNTHEVGLSPDDASLAPSHFPPIAR